MKKRIWSVALVALMCLTLFAGCGLVKGLERDIQVTVVVEGKTYGPYTVNIFNNAIVPNPQELDPPLVVADGMRFVGWTAKQNWQDLDESDVQITSNLYLIRYNEVKDFADEQGNVTLYPVVRPIVLKDLVVAWYNKESTSHLNQEIMDGFESDMRAFIASKGYDVDNLDIEVRGYEGNVGASCGAIKKDGDVDIMVGWSSTSNLTGTGGMDLAAILVNTGDIYINPDEGGRYAAKLQNRELANLVYQWILDTYQKVIHPTTLTLTPSTAEIEVGKSQVFQVSAEPSNAKTDVTWSSSDQSVATVDNGRVTAVATGTTTITATSAYDGNVTATATVTVVDPVPTDKETLTIAWYNLEKTSGLNETLIAGYVAALKEYLATKGYNDDNLVLVTRPYEGDVATSCDTIMSDGDVDIMLGWGKNIGTTGGMAGQFFDNVEGAKINPDVSRYVTRLTDSYLVRLAFWWTEHTYIDGFEGAEPVKPIEDGTKLVVGWYSKTGTSGLTADMMTAVQTAFTDYLVSLGYDQTKFQIEIRDIGNGKVGEVGTKVNGDGDYDILFGMGGNIDDADGAGINVKMIGDSTDKYLTNVTMGGKERNIAWLEMSQSPLAEIMWNWLFGLDGTEAWLGTEAATTAGFALAA